MYRTILAALDGSPRESDVFRAAAELAQRFGAALSVCRAVTIPVGLPDTVWAIELGQLDTALIADAKRGVARCIEGAPVAIAQSIVRMGQPADVVLDVAKEIGADLVVIGSHGYGAFERLIGTTASKIVHRSHCSVFVVRPSE
ncbi:MAG TPA: universal stress protein [Nannocystaceae bacterium]|nr:universal stress protein [Nannocystaceae bacterium]